MLARPLCRRRDSPLNPYTFLHLTHGHPEKTTKKNYVMNSKANTLFPHIRHPFNLSDILLFHHHLSTTRHSTKNFKSTQKHFKTNKKHKKTNKKTTKSNSPTTPPPFLSHELLTKTPKLPKDAKRALTLNMKKGLRGGKNLCLDLVRRTEDVLRRGYTSFSFPSFVLSCNYKQGTVLTE